MDEGDTYQELRPLLFSIAYQMVGSASEAEDLVQEAYLRFHRAVAGGAEVDSPTYRGGLWDRTGTTCARRGSAASCTSAPGCRSRW